MIKKLKLFSITFSTMVLLPFNALAVSCKGKNESGNKSVLSVANDEKNESFNGAIQDFIKDSFYGDKDASIVSLEDLQENMDSQTNNELKKYLSTLNDKLKTPDSTSVELNNQIIIQGLKNKIAENCGEVDKQLKDADGEFSSEFNEVGYGKILEISEDSTIFNLKRFSLKEILDSYKENDESKSSSADKNTIFADSEKLDIYNFNTNLRLTLNYGNGKKHLVSIKDYNLFVVLDKDKTILLTDGISKYLENKIIENSRNEQNAIPIYLDGHPNNYANEYLTEIIKKNNFDLTDQKNKFQIEQYLAIYYLPEIIFKNNDKESEIKVLRKNADITESGKNIRDLMVNTSEQNELKQINFLNLFGDDTGNPKITKEILENNIKVENFLTNSQIHVHGNGNYYLLGTGTMEVKRWIIKGFSLNPIKFTFKIFIKDYILEEQIDDLKTCLKHLTSIMADSKAIKRNSTIPRPISAEEHYIGKYTVNIEIPRKYLDVDVVKKVFVKPEPWAELDNILNAMFIERTKEVIGAENVFAEGSADYKFTTLTNILRFKVGRSKQETYFSDNGDEFPTLDKPINIYFVFNSFKINLTNDLFLKRRRVEPYPKKVWNKKTKRHENISVEEDGSKIWFR